MDGSKTLDSDEVLQMIRNIKGDKATSKKALRALQKMDANKDGNIDKKEFVSVMLKKMSKMNPSQFSAKCAQIQRGRRDLNIESVFHMWDQNGNGNYYQNNGYATRNRRACGAIDFFTSDQSSADAATNIVRSATIFSRATKF